MNFFFSFCVIFCGVSLAGWLLCAANPADRAERAGFDSAIMSLRSNLVVDKEALAQGLPPLDVRRKSLAPLMGVVPGVTYDAGDFAVGVCPLITCLPLPWLCVSSSDGSWSSSSRREESMGRGEGEGLAILDSSSSISKMRSAFEFFGRRTGLKGSFRVDFDCLRLLSSNGETAALSSKLPNFALKEEDSFLSSSLEVTL